MSINAVMQYVTQIGSHFQFEDQSLLTKPKFVTRVRQVLQAMGLFVRHHIRIGAVTAAAQASVEDFVISFL